MNLSGYVFRAVDNLFLQGKPNLYHYDKTVATFSLLPWRLGCLAQALNPSDDNYTITAPVNTERSWPSLPRGIEQQANSRGSHCCLLMQSQLKQLVFIIIKRKSTPGEEYTLQRHDFSVRLCMAGSGVIYGLGKGKKKINKGKGRGARKKKKCTNVKLVDGLPAVAVTWQSNLSQIIIRKLVLH